MSADCKIVFDEEAQLTTSVCMVEEWDEKSGTG